MSFKKLAATISYVTSLSWICRRCDKKEQDSDSNEDLTGLAKYLPYAGCVIGLFLAVLAWGVLRISHFEEHLLAGTLLATVWLIITGGLHMDGLMDTADGVYSHQTKERMLEIMQDSRVGNFGVLAGISILLLKIFSLAALAKNPLILLSLLLFVPVAARFCDLFTIAFFNYAKKEGKGKIWHDSTNIPGDLIFGLVPVVGLALFLSIYSHPTIVLIAFGSALVSGITLAFKLNSILGGQTGDTYGATVEISETGALLVSALLLPALS